MEEMRILLVGCERPTGKRELALLEQAFPKGAFDFCDVPYPRNCIYDPKDLYTEVAGKAPDAILIHPSILPATAIVVMSGMTRCFFFCEDRGSGRRSLREVRREHAEYEPSKKELQWANQNGFNVLVVDEKVPTGSADEERKSWLTEERRQLLGGLHYRTTIERFAELTTQEWEERVKGRRPNLIVFQSSSQLIYGFNALLLRRSKEECQAGLPRRFPHVAFSNDLLIEFFLEFTNLAEEH